jgi:hypothetical protein
MMRKHIKRRGWTGAPGIAPRPGASSVTAAGAASPIAYAADIPIALLMIDIAIP